MTDVTPAPTETPNVRIKNPETRAAINDILSYAGLALGTLMVVDMASAHFDLSAWTEPAFVGYAYLAAAFGLGVTRPNYPKL